MIASVASEKQTPNISCETEHLSSAGADPNDTLSGDATEDIEYRYYETETGAVLPGDCICWDEPELSEGAVLHTEATDGKKQYYTVSRMVQNEVVSVYLDRARNRAWKFLVLAALLVGCWFVIEFLLHQFV